MFAARIPCPPRLLSPFMRPAAAMPVLAVALAQHQDQIAAHLGLTLVEVAADQPLPAGCVLAFTAHAVFNEEAVRPLLKGPPRQLAIKSGTALCDFTAPFRKDGALPIFAGELRGSFDSLRANIATIDDDQSVDIRVDPFGPKPHRLRIPRVKRIAGVYEHWLHVLNLNHIFLQNALDKKPAKTKAKIHPTALVENSILGDDVEIEHHASVIDSYLGDGVKIGDHAVIHRSVIGAKSHTLVDTHLRRVVAGRGCTLSNLGCQDLLIGEDVFLTTGVAFFSGTPGENIRIGDVDSRRPTLAGAIGDRVVLGARSLLGEALAIPSQTVVVMKPGEGLSRVTRAGLASCNMRFGDPDRDL